MAKIRVFLLTYRRPHLLPRALASLRSQTHADWVCEVHNDAPDDPAPKAIVEACGDPRLVYVPHTENWGGARSFNHVYRGGQEPYASLLEDDNWWEPGFLSAALRVIEEKPEASLVWSNMRIWRETPERDWENTDRTVWATSSPGAPAVVFLSPQLLQCCDALHSHGAMVFRPNRFRGPELPAETPFAMTEMLRERAATGSLVLLPEPLANFAETLDTARAKDAVPWIECQMLLACSFFGKVRCSKAGLDRLWAAQRNRRPRGTPFLFLSGIALCSARILRPATISDWFWFVLGAARHPLKTAGALCFRKKNAGLWRWLEEQGRAQFLEGAALDERVTEKAVERLVPEALFGPSRVTDRKASEGPSAPPLQIDPRENK